MRRIATLAFAALAAAGSAAAGPFTTLPRCAKAEFPAEAMVPGGQWAPAEEGRYYPLGTAFRTGRGGSLSLAFGKRAVAKIGPGSSFGTRAQPLGTPSRTLVLDNGAVQLALAENFPEGLFNVAAPGFTVSNAAGESRLEYAKTPNGDKTTVRCVTGTLSIEGRHFSIKTMRAADEVVITSEHDHLVTILDGTSGDYVVKLDQGVRVAAELDDEGNRKEALRKEEREWHLTPRSKVVINRAVPAIGERMSVHTMAFDAAGEKQSDCVFCEGRPELNSGETVVKELDSDSLAKIAAQATETTEAADVSETDAEAKPAAEEKPVEEKPEN